LAACTSVSELAVLTTAESEADLPGGVRESAKVRLVRCGEIAPRGAARLLWDQWGVVEAADRSGADWVLFPKGFPPLVRWPRAKVCCYVHDNVFGYYHQQGWKAFPWFERLYFPAEVRRAARKSDLVVTNSEFTAAEVAALGRGGPTERVGIGFEMPPGLAGGPGRRDGILLLVSDQPHKLSVQAVGWLERWCKSRNRAVQVTAVGGLPAGLDWPAGDPGWVHHDRLGAGDFERVWAGARVLLYFSAYEGFGMPPLEAALRGVAPLASDLPALREQVPQEHLFDNRSFEDFAAKLDRLMGASPRTAFRPEPVRWAEVARRVVEAMQAA
jgi:hypothetical protein